MHRTRTVFNKSKKNRMSIMGTMVLIGCVAMILNEPIFSMITVGMIFALIFAYAKISFFTVFSFIMSFSYLQAVIKKVAGVAGGTLNWAGLNMPFYFYEMTIAIITLQLCLLFSVYFTKTVENEKWLYRLGSKISYTSGLLFAVLAVALVVLVFPSFPTFHMNTDLRRTQGLSSYYGLVLLALNITALTFDLSFKHKIFYVFYGFIAFWVLGHAERVEILGFIILFALTYLNKLDFSAVRARVRAHKKGIIYILFGLMIILMMYIGMTRMGDGQTVNLSTILYNLVVQPTCGDIVYVFNCSVDMWKSGNGLYGYSYIDYLLQLIPGSTEKFQIAAIMNDNYTVMGGGWFFTEPMANFGLIGTVVSNVMFCFAYSFFLRKPSRFTLFFWTPIVVEIFRTCWYGRSGWILSSFVIMPIIFLACTKFKFGSRGLRKNF